MADDRIDLDEWTVWITRAVEDETDRDVSGYRHVRSAIAAALREAFEAGLRESGNLYTEHSLALGRLLEQAAELAALRRELAARRAVDGWLASDPDRYVEVGTLSVRFNAVDRGASNVTLIASGESYPALAAALGLEVVDE